MKKIWLMSQNNYWTIFNLNNEELSKKQLRIKTNCMKNKHWQANIFEESSIEIFI